MLFELELMAFLSDELGHTSLVKEVFIGVNFCTLKQSDIYESVTTISNEHYLFCYSVKKM